MKWEKAVKAVKKLGFCSKWSKKAKKWKKRINWVPRIYRKRKHLGNIIYSVMYLTTKKR